MFAISVSIAALGIAFGATQVVKSARAEEEVPVTEPVAEETETEEKIFDKIVAEGNRISNTQILGTTIGALVGGILSAGITFLMSRVSKETMRDLIQFSRDSKFIYKDTLENAKNGVQATQDMIKEVKTMCEDFKGMNEQLKKQNETLKNYVDSLEAEKLEERKFFLTLISNNPDCVAKGVAEELNKYFGGKD